jgi:hypothetical protein
MCIIFLALTICGLTTAFAVAQNSAGDYTTSYWNNQGGLFLLAKVKEIPTQNLNSESV